MKDCKWKLVERGLYQLIRDGIPQNAFIDRHSDVTKSGRDKVIGWMECRKIDGKIEACGSWYTRLRTAKMYIEARPTLPDEEPVVTTIQPVVPKPKTKKLWARIGMTLEVTEEEYESIRSKMESEKRDTLTSEEIARFLNDGRPDGESYIPMDVWYDEPALY